jgi:hypothetical protein
VQVTFKVSAPTITTNGPLPTGTVGTAYSQTLQATGGTTPYTWEKVSGALPGGLFFNTTGGISGTPTADGLFSFRVRVTGSNGLSSEKDFTLTIKPSPMRTLTVGSANPSNGMEITVSPAGSAGQGNGKTAFSRTYAQGTRVTLTAPSTASGNIFQKWQRDGGDWATTVTTTVDMDANHTLTAVYVTPLFCDDAENGLGEWVAQSPWALTMESAHGSGHSWTDSPGGNYSNNTFASLYSPFFDLSNVDLATLTFWHRYDLEDGFDFGSVWIWDGTDFTQVASFTGTNTTWQQATIDLSPFAGLPSVQVVFQLFSDSSVTRDGWYIDDIEIHTPRMSGPPGAATLVTPTGPITDTTPTYTWDPVASATWYYLWVNDSMGKKHTQWYRAEEVGCGVSMGTCARTYAVTPDTALALGAGRWWVQTWSEAGYGPWSAGTNFTVRP